MTKKELDSLRTFLENSIKGMVDEYFRVIKDVEVAATFQDSLLFVCSDYLDIKPEDSKCANG